VPERHVGGQVPDRSTRLVEEVGGEPPLGEIRPAPGASVVVLAPTVSGHHPGGPVAVPLPLWRQGVAPERAALAASPEPPGRHTPGRPGTVDGDVHGIGRPLAEAGLELVRERLPAGDLEEMAARPLRRKQDDVAQGRAADAGDEIRKAVEGFHLIRGTGGEALVVHRVTIARHCHRAGFRRSWLGVDGPRPSSHLNGVSTIMEDVPLCKRRGEARRVQVGEAKSSSPSSLPGHLDAESWSLGLALDAFSRVPPPPSSSQAVFFEFWAWSACVDTEREPAAEALSWILFGSTLQ